MEFTDRTACCTWGLLSGTMGEGSSGTATEERRLLVREWEMERKSRDSDTSRGFTGCCSGHGRPSL